MSNVTWSLQHKRDTAANFTSGNPTLLAGQFGIETDGLTIAPKFKIGDGVTAWGTLPYATSGGLTIGTSSITGGTNTRILYNNNGVLGEYSVTGTGTTAVLSNSPTLINAISTPSSNASKSYALRLTDDGSGVANPDLFIDSIYNARVVFKNITTSNYWYLHNHVGTGAAGKDSIGFGVDVNPGNNFLAISLIGNTYVKNNLRIGDLSTVPTAQIHIKAGTASASTAPLKFTSGTNLTTPEAGVIEYDGTYFYATPSSTRKTIAFTDMKGGTSIFKASFLSTIGHVPQMTNGNPTTTLAYAADQVNMVPFILDEDLSITSLNFIVTTNVAATNACIGIYEWDETTNNVGTQIVTSGLLSCATTGTKTHSFTAIVLSAHKKYVLAYVNDNINIRIYSTNYNSLSYLPVSSSNGNQYSVITKSITAGWTSLPASITADGGRVQVSPIIGML